MNTTTRTMPLGKNQLAMLWAISKHGGYYKGGSWCWTGHRTTVRLLDSLVSRGLVERIDYEIDPLIRAPYVTDKWVLTEAGRLALAYGRS